jgi:hypothetical protein
LQTFSLLLAPIPFLPEISHSSGVGEERPELLLGDPVQHLYVPVGKSLQGVLHLPNPRRTMRIGTSAAAQKKPTRTPFSTTARTS